MQNVNQFERHRAALEQCIHNSVHDAEIRNKMLAHVGQMGAAMHAEERTADAALRTHHARSRTGTLMGWILGVKECAA